MVPAVLWVALQGILMMYRSRGENAPEPLAQAVIAVSALIVVVVVVVIVFAVAFRSGRTAEKVLTERFPDAFIVRAVKENDLLLGVRMLADVVVDVDALVHRVQRLFPLVLNDAGVELWTSDDDPVRVAALPWSAVGGVRMGTLSRPGRESRAVMLEIRDAGRSVTLPFIVFPQKGSGVSYLGPALEVLESKFRQRGKRAS
ncbi:hypothetical protein AB4Y63_17150 [Leifsonia sp. YAF41]|uniref:hypothetical protein n=1 Tax=Leifsonia sp. YAF41 TaxID=3233086 RepID=UPI003F9E4EE2